MKKITALILSIGLAVSAFAQGSSNTVVLRNVEAKQKVQNTNLLDKLPGEGYVGTVNLELNAPGAFNSTSAGGFTTTHGWMVTPRFFFGAGTGYIQSFSYKHGVIPVYAEGRYYFPSEFMRRIYPHIGARLGGQWATEGGWGVYSQVAVGVRVPVSEAIALNVEIGPQYITKYTAGKASTIVQVNQPFVANGQKFGIFFRFGVEF